ncbi:MAG: DUF3810 domain-containing protein [Bacteroidota bacterium]|nr:DUF3810 domain-containing protein [Bacteroidota bacterium]
MNSEKKSRRIRPVWIVLALIIIILIKVTSYFPLFIEHYYSRGIYPVISSFYRIVFGWIPFSLGDLLYALAGVFLMLATIRTVKIIINRKRNGISYPRIIKKALLVLATIYIYFNISWGLNYNRPGIAYQLGMNPKTHTDGDIRMITAMLLKKVNENRVLLGDRKITIKSYDQVFRQAQNGYRNVATQFPFLEYRTRSIKKSIYGRMGNFLGFLGYFNPFTGEAQVNLTQPRFLIPYVSCHEMAHQLGYASESEANFVGYLAAINSTDTVFHYSAYFDLFNYANRELFLRDSSLAKNNYEQLDILVKKDEEELREYWRKSDNAIEPLIKLFYDHYLKANQQDKGVQSYNEVIGWLISYYNKYGKI